MQIIFVFVCLSFTQGNHHDFIFAKEESVKKRRQVTSVFTGCGTPHGGYTDINVEKN